MIYFTQDSDTLAIKIGYTAGEDADARRRALQTGNPSVLVLLGTMPGDVEEERRLHAYFAADRVAGEWFRPTPRLIRWISEAVTAGQNAAWRKSFDAARIYRVREIAGMEGLPEIAQELLEILKTILSVYEVPVAPLTPLDRLLIAWDEADPVARQKFIEQRIVPLMAGVPQS